MGLTEANMFSAVLLKKEADIEQLRAEVERLTGLLENSGMTVRELLANDGDLRAEVERLRAVLQAIAGGCDIPASVARAALEPKP